MSLQFHPLRVRAIRPDTQEGVVVTLDVPQDLQDTFRFRQGQYLTLRSHIAGQDTRRSYSICAGVDDGELRVGVRRVPGGTFSNWVNDHLQVGHNIDVMPPQGHFGTPLNTHVARNYLGVAGGSGITPILSIMKTLLAREPMSHFTLIYANRTLRSTMFKDEIQDLKDRYMTRLTLHHVFSREHTDTPFNGRLDRHNLASFFEQLVPVDEIDHVFVCGPNGFIDEAQAALTQAELPQECVHVERFGAPDDKPGERHVPQAQEGDAAVAKIQIIRDGQSRHIVFRQSHPSILDAAAKAGLDVPYSCKSGVCCTCRAKVLQGEVRMARNFALDKEELAAGFILTCQARALTDTVVLSFDER